MFGAIAGGIASALAGGAMSKLFGGGQKAASGGIQGDVLRSEERFSRNAETDLVCRLLLEKKKKNKTEQTQEESERCKITKQKTWERLISSTCNTNTTHESTVTVSI